MKKYLLSLLAVIFLGYCSIDALAVNNHDPINLLRSIADEMIDHLNR